jgi:hypothetical protein
MGKQQAPASYRIRLEREDTGETICTWGRIPGQRIGPMIASLKSVLPFMVAAARARHAFDSLLEALR